VLIVRNVYLTVFYNLIEFNSKVLIVRKKFSLHILQFKNIPMLWYF